MSTMLKLLVIGILVSVAAGQVTVAPESGLGRRHTDPLRGFSIRPPAGAQVVRQSGAGEMVQFILKRPGTDDVPIRMSILHGLQKGEPVTDLAMYGQALAIQLHATQNFKVDAASVRVIQAAGKPAIVLTGPVGGSVFGLYRHEVWVQADPNRFLVIRTSGALDATDQVTRVSQASLDTLMVFDPAAIRARLEQDLARGGDVLGRLTPDAIRQVLAPRDSWMAIVRGSKVIGFIHIQETLAAQDQTDGIRVVAEMAIVGADEARTLTREVSYASFDRTVERWETTAVEAEGATEKNRHHQFGIKQGDLLMVQTVVGPHETKTFTRKIPTSIYLPKALSLLAYRLIDRSKAAGFAFAQYDPITRAIEMRTITVKGPKPIVLGGTPFAATELTDQVGLGAAALAVVVDSRGVALKLTRDDGTVLQQTTAEAIRVRFARELEMLHPPQR